MSTEADLNRLSRQDRERVRILEAMENKVNLSSELKAEAKRIKNELLDAAASEPQDALEDSDSLDRGISPLTYSGANSSVLLQILIDQEEDGSYYARVSEGETGSESDRSGATIAELIENCLHWAGIDIGSADSSVFHPTDTLADVRTLLKAAARDADFELSVKIYASF